MLTTQLSPIVSLSRLCPSQGSGLYVTSGAPLWALPLLGGDSSAVASPCSCAVFSDSLDQVPEKAGKSGSPPVIVNKVLSKHNHAHLVTYYFFLYLLLCYNDRAE